MLLQYECFTQGENVAYIIFVIPITHLIRDKAHRLCGAKRIPYVGQRVPLIWDKAHLLCGAKRTPTKNLNTRNRGKSDYLNNITNYINSITTQPAVVVASGHRCHHCYIYQIPSCAYCAKRILWRIRERLLVIG